MRRHPDGRQRIGGHGRAQANGPYGPYGITTTEPQDTSGAKAHAADVSRRDGMNDRRTAAISEAALLAALALGSALLLAARGRAPGLGT